MQVQVAVLAAGLIALVRGMPHEPPALLGLALNSSTDGTRHDERLSARQDDPWANPVIYCTGSIISSDAPYQDNQNTLDTFFTSGGVIDNVWVRAFDDVIYLSEAFACRYSDANAPSAGSWQSVWGLIDAACNVNGQVGAGWARSDVIQLTLGRDVYDAGIC